MLEQISLDNGSAMDEFVIAHPQGHFMQTSAWGCLKADWEWTGLLSRRADGSIRGTMALLLHHSRCLPCSLLYAPRGPVFDCGDWDTLGELMDGAGQVARQQGVYLLRMDPQYEANDRDAAAAFQHLGLQIDPISDFSAFQARMVYQLPLQDTVAAQLARCSQKTRYNIRLAQRRGITVRQEQDLPAFYCLLERSAERDGFQPRPRSYYARLFRVFGSDVRLYLARKDGQAAAAALCLRQGSKTWFLAGGCDPTMSRDMASHLLHWTAISQALADGCTLYDFGGVEGYPTKNNPHYGLHHFKAGFGAEFHAYLGQMDLVYRPAAQLAVNLVGHLPSRNKKKHRQPV